MRLLLAQKADVRAYDDVPLRATFHETNFTTLGHVSTAKLLIASKANVTDRFDKFLRFVGSKGNISMAQVLLDSKQDLEAVGAALRIALREASFFGQTSMVKFLLEKRADIVENNYDPLVNASSRDYESTVNLLVENKEQSRCN